MSSEKGFKGVKFRGGVSCSVCNRAVRAAVSVPGALIIAPVINTKTSDIALWCGNCNKTICVKCAIEETFGGAGQMFKCPQCGTILGPHER